MIQERERRSPHKVSTKIGGRRNDEIMNSQQQNTRSSDLLLEHKRSSARTLISNKKQDILKDLKQKTKETVAAAPKMPPHKRIKVVSVAVTVSPVENNKPKPKVWIQQNVKNSKAKEEAETTAASHPAPVSASNEELFTADPAPTATITNDSSSLDPLPPTASSVPILPTHPLTLATTKDEQEEPTVVVLPTVVKDSKQTSDNINNKNAAVPPMASQQETVVVAVCDHEKVHDDNDKHKPISTLQTKTDKPIGVDAIEKTNTTTVESVVHDNSEKKPPPPTMTETETKSTNAAAPSVEKPTNAARRTVVVAPKREEKNSNNIIPQPLPPPPPVAKKVKIAETDVTPVFSSSMGNFLDKLIADDDGEADANVNATADEGSSSTAVVTVNAATASTQKREVKNSDSTIQQPLPPCAAAKEVKTTAPAVFSPSIVDFLDKLVADDDADANGTADEGPSSAAATATVKRKVEPTMPVVEYTPPAATGTSTAAAASKSPAVKGGNAEEIPTASRPGLESTADEPVVAAATAAGGGDFSVKHPAAPTAIVNNKPTKSSLSATTLLVNEQNQPNSGKEKKEETRSKPTYLVRQKEEKEAAAAAAKWSPPVQENKVVIHATPIVSKPVASAAVTVQSERTDEQPQSSTTVAANTPVKVIPAAPIVSQPVTSAAVTASWERKDEQPESSTAATTAPLVKEIPAAPIVSKPVASSSVTSRERTDEQPESSTTTTTEASTPVKVIPAAPVVTQLVASVKVTSPSERTHEQPESSTTTASATAPAKEYKMVIPAAPVVRKPAASSVSTAPWAKHSEQPESSITTTTNTPKELSSKVKDKTSDIGQQHQGDNEETNVVSSSAPPAFIAHSAVNHVDVTELSTKNTTPIVLLKPPVDEQKQRPIENNKPVEVASSISGKGTLDQKKDVIDAVSLSSVGRSKEEVHTPPSPAVVTVESESEKATDPTRLHTSVDLSIATASLDEPTKLPTRMPVDPPAFNARKQPTENPAAVLSTSAGASVASTDMTAVKSSQMSKPAATLAAIVKPAELSIMVNGDSKQETAHEPASPISNEHQKKEDINIVAPQHSPTNGMIMITKTRAVGLGDLLQKTNETIDAAPQTPPRTEKIKANVTVSPTTALILSKRSAIIGNLKQTNRKSNEAARPVITVEQIPTDKPTNATESFAAKKVVPTKVSTQTHAIPAELGSQTEPTATVRDEKMETDTVEPQQTVAKMKLTIPSAFNGSETKSADGTAAAVLKSDGPKGKVALPVAFTGKGIEKVGEHQRTVVVPVPKRKVKLPAAFTGENTGNTDEQQPPSNVTPKKLTIPSAASTGESTRIDEHQPSVVAAAPKTKVKLPAAFTGESTESNDYQPPVVTPKKLTIPSAASTGKSTRVDEHQPSVAAQEPPKTKVKLPAAFTGESTGNSDENQLPVVTPKKLTIPSAFGVRSALSEPGRGKGSLVSKNETPVVNSAVDTEPSNDFIEQEKKRLLEEIARIQSQISATKAETPEVVTAQATSDTTEYEYEEETVVDDEQEEMTEYEQEEIMEYEEEILVEYEEDSVDQRQVDDANNFEHGHHEHQDDEKGSNAEYGYGDEQNLDYRQKQNEGESDMSCDSPAFKCFLRRRSIQMMKDIVETMMKEKEAKHSASNQVAAEPSTGHDKERANFSGANEIEAPAKPTAALEPQSGKENREGGVDSNSNVRHDDDAVPFRDKMIPEAQPEFLTGQEQLGPQTTLSGQSEVHQEQYDHAAHSVEFGHDDDEYGYDDSEEHDEYGYDKNQPEDDSNDVGYGEDTEKQEDGANIIETGNGESGMSCDSPAFQCFLRRRSIQMMKDIVETMMKEGNKTKDSSSVVENGTQVDTADPASGQAEEDPPGAYAGAKEAELPVLEPPISSRSQTVQASTTTPEDEALADSFSNMSGENKDKEDELGDRDLHNGFKVRKQDDTEALHDGSTIQSANVLTVRNNPTAGQGQDVPYSNKDKAADSYKPIVTSRSQSGGDAHNAYKQATIRDEYVGQLDYNVVRAIVNSASKIHDSVPPSHNAERGHLSPVENDIVQVVQNSSKDVVSKRTNANPPSNNGGFQQKHSTQKQSNDDDHAIRGGGSRSAPPPPTSIKRNEGQAKGNNKKSSKSSSKKSLWRRPVSLQSMPTVVSLFLPFGAVRGPQR